MDGKTPDEKAADAIALTFQGGIITPGEFIDGYFTCGDSVVKGDPEESGDVIRCELRLAYTYDTHDALQELMPMRPGYIRKNVNITVTADKKTLIATWEDERVKYLPFGSDSDPDDDGDDDDDCTPIVVEVK